MISASYRNNNSYSNGRKPSSPFKICIAEPIFFIIKQQPWTLRLKHLRLRL